MNFSLWNFKAWFVQKHIDLTYNISDTTADISLLSLITSKDQLLEHSAGICDGILANYPDYHTVMFHNLDNILFPVASPSQILNAGNQMIEYFTKWENDLYDIILNNGTISNLLDISEKILNYPIAILSPNNSILFATKNWTLLLPGIDFNSIINTDDIFSPTPIFRTIFSNGSKNLLIHSLFENNKHFGTLIAYECDFKFTPGDINLFHTLSQAVVNCYKSTKKYPESTHQLDAFFVDALSNHSVDTSKLKVLFKEFSWPENKLYSIFCIRPRNNDTHPKLNIYLPKLKELIAYSCCFIFEENIIFIAYTNSHAVKTTANRLLNRLPSDLFVIGQSLPSYDFYDLKDYYRQSMFAADYALSFGQPIIYMEDILPQAVFQFSAENPWLRSLIHPDIKKLIMSTQAEHEDLLKTLYYYLILGRNSSNAADALYIHRNTLRYRINKIKSLLDSDLTNPDYIQKLLTSYLIIGKNFD